jgi:hypothetical protein
MRSCILTAFILLAAVAEAGEKSAGTTRVEVEVFTVGLGEASSETLRFARAQGALENGEDPDARSRALAERAASEIVFIHSTSWRWEPQGRIILTYLAWARDGALSREAQSVPKLAPPDSTDSLRPRPVQIRMLDPLAHGLRHLAYLLRQSIDGRVASALGQRATELLSKLEPSQAGRL